MNLTKELQGLYAKEDETLLLEIKEDKIERYSMFVN